MEEREAIEKAAVALGVEKEHLPWLEAVDLVELAERAGRDLQRLREERNKLQGEIVQLRGVMPHGWVVREDAPLGERRRWDCLCGASTDAPTRPYYDESCPLGSRPLYEEAKLYGERNLSRLRRLACRYFGWGPAEGPIVFRREGNGWRVGNGICESAWTYRMVPQDPGTALVHMEGMMFPTTKEDAKVETHVEGKHCRECSDVVDEPQTACYLCQRCEGCADDQKHWCGACRKGGARDQ